MVRDALVVAKYLGAKGAAGGLGVCPSAATSPASSSVARIKRAAAFTAPLERSPTGANARHRAAALREPRAACAISPLLGRQRRPAARACVVDAERSQPRLRAADSARPWDPRRAYNASGSVCQGGARAAHVPNARATREQWARNSRECNSAACADAQLSPRASAHTHAHTQPWSERRYVNIAPRALLVPGACESRKVRQKPCRPIPYPQTASPRRLVVTMCVIVQEAGAQAERQCSIVLAALVFGIRLLLLGHVRRIGVAQPALVGAFGKCLGEQEDDGGAVPDVVP